ncbi:MAG: amino acid ABC transporter ATP-binding protein [Deltaproteobacteria bacterium]|jgi:polar amino acid transport system ATP-binding protein|nr:amino acid ABC transporter ATP-binding protein [Deltaproteobacteria bacterium]
MEARNITKYLGGKLILDQVSLSLNKGEFKVLIGPSGSGKSTLLQCLHFLLIPDKGDVLLEGKSAMDMSHKNICAFRQEIGMIFQDFNLFDHLTAKDNVAIALRKVKKWSKDQALSKARDELDKVGLADKAELYPAQLSGGQKQRVSIARAMAMEPKLMLLDEPTSALDPELIGEVLNVVANLAKGGMTMLMVTHQIGFARHLVHEINFMENGRVIESGHPESLLANPASRTAMFCARLSELTGNQ